MALPLLLLLSATALGQDVPVDDPLFEDPPSRQASVRRAGAIGLGIGAGTSAAGVSAKLWVNERLAFQGVVGAAFERGHQRSTTLVETGAGAQTGLGAGVDVLVEGNSFFEVDDVELGWSAGGGAGLWATDDLGIAVGGVVGLELGFLTVPLDLVVEYRPRVLLLPSPAMDWFSLSGHVRWYL